MTAPPLPLVETLRDRYRVERELGRGGMATVWLAQDLRHDRRVALKVLRPELSAVIGAERFLAEIRTTANLQHPHILPLFDSGRTGGPDALGVQDFIYYVMPFVEGESLRDRLLREKQLPVADAVRIAGEVASALDYAHRHGVIHRDIKPENILLHDGRALVADFGVALAVRGASDTRMTETGMSLGTPHYMSPEQAMGEREITPRSDVYALACVLYEMLTGEPPFTGPTAQAIVARVMTESPRPLSVQRHTIPAHVEAAVLTALEKLPADRFASAAESPSRWRTAAPSGRFRCGPCPRGRRAGGRRCSSGWVSSAPQSPVLGCAPSRGRPRRHSRRPDTGASCCRTRRRWRTSAAAPWAWGASRWRSHPMDPRWCTSAGAAGPINCSAAGWTRARSRRSPAQGAYDPIFSPDGQWIAFFAGPELRKVPAGGGSPVALAQASEAWGASWVTPERILVTLREGLTLAWVPAAGGPLEPVPLSGWAAFRGPTILPDRRHALGHVWFPSGVIGIAAADLSSGRVVGLTARGPRAADSVPASDVIAVADPRFLPPGHLTYVRGGRLMAAPFDPVALLPTGPAVELVAGVREEQGGRGQYAVTPDGTLIYAEGARANVANLVWVRASGQANAAVLRRSRRHVRSLTRRPAGRDPDLASDLRPRAPRARPGARAVHQGWDPRHSAGAALVARREAVSVRRSSRRGRPISR